MTRTYMVKITEERLYEKFIEIEDDALAEEEAIEQARDEAMEWFQDVGPERGEFYEASAYLVEDEEGKEVWRND